MTLITEVCSNGFKGKRARFESVLSRAEYTFCYRSFYRHVLFTRHTVINDQTSRARVTPERAR